MKKKLFSIVSTLLAFCMVLTLAACGGSTDETSDASTPAVSTQQQSTAVGENAGPALPIVKDKLTLKFLCYNWGDAVYGNDMPVFQELEKRTNIHLEWELLPAEDNLTKLNLIMVSGDLPDLISFSDPDNSKKTFDKYSAQGALAPLDDLIDKFAPNIKSVLNNPPYEVPYLKAELKGPDGKLYSLPNMTQIHTGEVFGIRQDWLDKVGMKVPETTDDLYNVLKAFKDQKVDGKGEVVGFCPDNAGKTLQDLTILMNAFGSHESFYVDKKDNTVKFGPMETNYKDGLAYCNKLYSEGLIDKNYINNNTDTFRAKASNNQIALFYAWPMSGLGFCNTAVAKVDPNAKYVAMLPLKGPNGDRFKERPQPVMTPRTVITTANKHQEETIKYLDYIFSEEGNLLMNYGIEGKDYTLDSSGNPKFTDYVLKNPDGKDPATVRITEGMQVGMPFVATLDCEVQAATDEAVKEAWNLYTENDVLYPNFPNLPLDEAQIGEISGQITDIRTFVDETSNKFIMGNEPLTNFDKFAETIKSMGIDDILQIYNEAYKKYLEFDK